MDYQNKLKSGDIIVVYNPHSWFSRAIKGLTGYKASHVAQYIGQIDGVHKIIEANFKRIRRLNAKDYPDSTNVYVLRYCGNKSEGLTESQLLNIIRCGNEAINRPYSFGQLLILALKYIFKINHIPDVSKKAMICSELVAEIWLKAGIRLVNKPPYETVPGDILNSKLLKLVEG